MSGRLRPDLIPGVNVIPACYSYSLGWRSEEPSHRGEHFPANRWDLARSQGTVLLSVLWRSVLTRWLYLKAKNGFHSPAGGWGAHTPPAPVREEKMSHKATFTKTSKKRRSLSIGGSAARSRAHRPRRARVNSEGRGSFSPPPPADLLTGEGRKKPHRDTEGGRCEALRRVLMRYTPSVIGKLVCHVKTSPAHDSKPRDTRYLDRGTARWNSRAPARQGPSPQRKAPAIPSQIQLV
jgi:hypothetical protein